MLSKDHLGWKGQLWGGDPQAAPRLFWLEFVNLFELPSVLQFSPMASLPDILHEPFAKWLGESSPILGL